MTIKTQIPFSATHFQPDTGFWWREPNVTQRGWHRLISNGWYDAGIGFPAQTLTPVRSLHSDHFEHPKTAPVVTAIDVPVWDGTGLPPVRTVCEFQVETDDWRKCEVVAHKDEYAVCWIHVNKVLCTGGGAVRPIRTPEQIAAEEREKSIIFAMGDTRTLAISESTKRILIERLYDAGHLLKFKS